MSDYKFSIEAIKVNKIYNKKEKKIDALNNFNINIKKGSIYGLLGPNGAGKSTFINMLGGLVLKTSGSIKICGVDIDNNSTLTVSPQLGHSISFLFKFLLIFLLSQTHLLL